MQLKWFKDYRYLGGQAGSSNHPTVQTVEQQLPNIQQGSGQLSHETMDQFFSRRDVDDAKLVAVISSSARASYEGQLTSHNQTVAEDCMLPCPGKNGPIVFKWTDYNGFYVRERVDPSHTWDTWRDYTDGQQRYNAVRNEWDLAQSFQPPEGPVNPMDYSGFQEDWEEPEPAANPNPTGPQVIMDDLEAGCELEAGYTMSQAEVVQQSQGWPWEDMLDLLVFWYGFHPSLVDYTSPIPSNKMTVASVHQRLAETELLSFPPEGSAASAAITDFIHLLLSSPQGIPPSIWDLSGVNPLTTWEAGIALTVRHHQTEADGQIHTVYSLSGEGMTYQIIVRSLATVLQCIHLQDPSIMKVAQHLIQLGISFHTCRLGGVPVTQPEQPFWGLGSRSEDYQMMSWDYTRYTGM